MKGLTQCLTFGCWYMISLTTTSSLLAPNLEKLIRKPPLCPPLGQKLKSLKPLDFRWKLSPWSDPSTTIKLPNHSPAFVQAILDQQLSSSPQKASLNESSTSSPCQFVASSGSILTSFGWGHVIIFDVLYSISENIAISIAALFLRHSAPPKVFPSVCPMLRCVVSLSVAVSVVLWPY